MRWLVGSTSVAASALLGMLAVVIPASPPVGASGAPCEGAAPLTALPDGSLVTAGSLEPGTGRAWTYAVGGDAVFVRVLKVGGDAPVGFGAGLIVRVSTSCEPDAAGCGLSLGLLVESRQLACERPEIGTGVLRVLTDDVNLTFTTFAVRLCGAGGVCP